MSVLRDSGAALHAALPGIERGPAFRLARRSFAHGRARQSPGGGDAVHEGKGGGWAWSTSRPSGRWTHAVMGATLHAIFRVSPEALGRYDISYFSQQLRWRLVAVRISSAKGHATFSKALSDRLLLR